MWLVWAFLSAFLLGFYDVCKKKALASNAVIPVLFLNTLFCSLIFIPCILLSFAGKMDSTHMLYVPYAPLRAHLFIIFKAGLVLTSWIFGYFSIKHLPLTLVGPIQATRPVMVLIGAGLFFGEQLNIWQWLGVSLAIFSVWMLSRSGKKEGISFSHNKWILFVFLAAIFGALSGLYDKYLMAPESSQGAGLNQMLVQSWYNIYQSLFMFLAIIFIWLPHRKNESPFVWKWTIPLISLFLSMADFVYFYALSHPDAMISIVSMVRRGSVLVSFTLGAIIFHERNLQSKAIDLVLVLISMILLWIGTYY